MMAEPNGFAWERDPDVRNAELVHCLGVLDGDGPEHPSRAQLAVCVDWALRERYRAEVAQKRLRQLRRDLAVLIKHLSPGGIDSAKNHKDQQ